jgi:hypothetical protein
VQPFHKAFSYYRPDAVNVPAQYLRFFHGESSVNLFS